jgi:hypothetical protein
VVDLSIRINGLSDGDPDLGDGGFQENAMKSKPFPPSMGTLAYFVTVESWTAREKAGWLLVGCL